MTLAVAVAVAASAAAAPVAQAAPAAGGAARVDFNGDGVSDVVTAAPDATVSGRARAGYKAALGAAFDRR
ncbi:hypothetical protein ACWES4_09140 [Streptomyces sp. NPDC004011]